MKTETELRGLDAWIAEFVMNWKRTENPDDVTATGETLFWHRKTPNKLEVVLKGRAYEMKFERGGLFSHSWTYFHPTEDSAAAMQVWEKCIECRSIVINKEPAGELSVAELKIGALGLLHLDGGVTADTIPLAICLFAKALFSK